MGVSKLSAKVFSRENQCKVSHGKVLEFIYLFGLYGNANTTN